MARFTNQAQLRYGNEITNSNIAVGEITEVLSATKTAVRDTYGQNENVTYVISIVNSGTTAFNGITVTDNLGEYLFNTRELTPLTYIPGTVKYYANGILQATPAVTAGPPLTITGITVPAGGNVTLTYEAEVNSYAPLAAEAKNSALVKVGSMVPGTNTATIAGAGVTPVTVNETVNAVSGPLLTITKSVSPVPVTENGTLTYTFLIQNLGNTAADAATGVVITDTFNPVLENLTVNFNGAAWAEGTNYTYDTTTGLFTGTAGGITVPAATYTQDPVTGAWGINPGVSTLVISGTV